MMMSTWIFVVFTRYRYINPNEKEFPRMCEHEDWVVKDSERREGGAGPSRTHTWFSLEPIKQVWIDSFFCMHSTATFWCSTLQQRSIQREETICQLGVGGGYVARKGKGKNGNTKHTLWLNQCSSSNLLSSIPFSKSKATCSWICNCIYRDKEKATATKVDGS